MFLKAVAECITKCFLFDAKKKSQFSELKPNNNGKIKTGPCFLFTLDLNLENRGVKNLCATLQKKNKKKEKKMCLKRQNVSACTDHLQLRYVFTLKCKLVLSRADLRSATDEYLKTGRAGMSKNGT